MYYFVSKSLITWYAISKPALLGTKGPLLGVILPFSFVSIIVGVHGISSE